MDAKCVEFHLTDASCNAISPGLYVGYILLAIALIAAIVLPLINTLKNPGVLVKSGISLGVLVVLFAVAYGMADNNVSEVGKALNVSPFSSQLIGAGMIMFYITLFIAIAGLVYSEINKALK